MHTGGLEHLELMEASIPISTTSETSVVVVVHHLADNWWSTDLIRRLTCLRKVSCRFISIHDDSLFLHLKASTRDRSSFNSANQNFSNSVQDELFALSAGIVANSGAVNVEHVVDIDLQENLSLAKHSRSLSFYQRVHFGVNMCHRSIFVFSQKFLEDLWPEISDLKMASLMKERESILLFVSASKEFYVSNDDHHSRPVEEFVSTSKTAETKFTEHDGSNETPILDFPLYCIGDIPMDLRGLPTVMVGSGTDRDECWFRELVAWVVMEPYEVTAKLNNKYIKNGHVLCSVDTLTMNLCCNVGCCSNSKFENRIKREMRLLESEIEGRKLTSLPIESMAKEVSANFQADCISHLLLHHAPTLCLFFFLLFLGLVFCYPHLESAALGKPSSANSHIRGLIVWLVVLTSYLFVIFAIKRKSRLGMFKKLGQMNQNLKSHSVIAGVEKLGFLEYNKHMLHFMHYDYGPCVAYLQEKVITFNNISTDPYQRFMKNKSHSLMPSDELRPNELQPLNEDKDNTNLSIQMKTDLFLLELSGKYGCLLASMKLQRPITDRHMNGYVCLCQFVEKSMNI